MMLSLFKKFKKTFVSASLIAAACSTGVSLSHAETEKGQIQVGLGLGMLAASKGFDVSFASFIEPEYFVTKHISIGLQLGSTIGRLDSISFAGRGRYYFDIPNMSRLNIFVGAGIGYIIDFADNETGFGDAHLAVAGIQYDINDHFKIGSDLSLNLLFDGDGTAFGGRIMPLVVKWAF